MKYLPFFAQGKEVYFHLESGKNYPFLTLLSGKKRGFLTKSQGRLIWGTAGNPELIFLRTSALVGLLT